MPTAGKGRRLDRARPGGVRIMGGEPVPGYGGWRPAEARGEGRVMPRPSDRQEIASDSLSDRCMAERDGPVALEDEPVGEGLDPACPQVGVQDPGADSRPGDGPRRRAAGVRIERACDRGELLEGQRTLGQGDETQDPPALE